MSGKQLTLALASQNCDEDFSVMKRNGAAVLEAPKNQPWGVRTAYFQGPGRLIVEIEEALT